MENIYKVPMIKCLCIHWTADHFTSLPKTSMKKSKGHREVCLGLRGRKRMGLGLPQDVKSGWRFGECLTGPAKHKTHWVPTVPKENV